MDIALTGNGDIQISAIGDVLLIGEEDEMDRQGLAYTLFVNSPDFIPYPDFGANLDALLGKTLNEETLDLGVELIMDAVPEVVDVHGVLHNEYNVIIFFINHPAFNRSISLIYSIRRGLLVGEEAENLLHEIFLED